jgi:hypothetical protein
MNKLTPAQEAWIPVVDQTLGYPNSTHKFTPAQEAWLQDLETTEDPQFFNYLAQYGTKARCCLGRACDLAIASGLDVDVRNHVSATGIKVSYEESLYGLPTSVQEWLGLRGNGGDTSDSTIPSLTSLNDAYRLSFKQIAAVVRNHPDSYFVDPIPQDEAEPAIEEALR